MLMNLEAELVDRFSFDGAEEIWETRLWITNKDGGKLWSTKPDHVLLKGSEAMTQNAKTGRGVPVPIDRNWQVASEAAAVWFHRRPTKVITCLVHPRHPDVQYQTKIWTAEECAQAMLDIGEFVEEIQKPNAPRTPNSISCEHCRAKGICPEYRAQSEQLTRDLRQHWNDEGLSFILDKDPKQRAEDIDATKRIIKDNQEKITLYTKLMQKDPNAVADYKLRRQYITDIVDEEQAIETIEEVFGLDAMHATVTLSINALEDFLAKKHGRAAARELIATHLGHLLKRRAKQPSIERTTR
jgi:hypothetical protein